MSTKGGGHEHRIRYLDGLRGVAVLAVIGWHYCGATYAESLPYGAKYSFLPVFGQGWLGVYLFFLISGFVIFRTLETSTSLPNFLVRRWIRLAPALLLCAIVISLASHVLPKMPAGGYRPIDIAAALTFVSPSFYHALLRIDVMTVDGAYWTLITEFSFYAIFGALYFLVGWRRAVLGLIVLWIVASATRFYPVPQLGRAPEILWWAGLEYFGWFASGALFYRAHETGSRKLYWTAVAIAVACSLTNYMVVPWYDKAALLGVVILFAAAQRMMSLQKLLSMKGLFFVGTVSYPLYLLHNHLGIGLIAFIGQGRWAPVAPFVVVALLIAASYVVHAKYEAKVSPWLRRHILPHTTRPWRLRGAVPAVPAVTKTDV